MKMVLQLFQVVLLLWKISTALAQSPAQAKSGCQSQCGYVTIPYPFGIGANCYVDEWFSISCNETFNPPKPFLNSTKLEVLAVSTELGTVRVKYPVNSTCADRSSANVMSMEGSPFVFSQADNRFTGVGCNNLALMTLLNGSTIGGCLSFCLSGSTEGSSTTCNGIDCCQTTIPSDLQSFNTTIESIETKENSEGCKYAFLVDQQWFESNVRVAKASAIQNMDNFPVVLEWWIDRWKYDSLVMNKSISFNNSTLCESGGLSTALPLVTRPQWFGVLAKGDMKEIRIFLKDVKILMNARTQRIALVYKKTLDLILPVKILRGVVNATFTVLQRRRNLLLNRCL